MANHKSALKRIRANNKKRLENRSPSFDRNRLKSVLMVTKFGRKPAKQQKKAILR